MKTVKIHNRRNMLILLVLLLGHIHYAQAQEVAVTVTDNTTGNLANNLYDLGYRQWGDGDTSNDKYKITKLTITGTIGGDDFRVLRQMAGQTDEMGNTGGKLVYLDLGGVTGIEETNVVYFKINVSDSATIKKDFDVTKREFELKEFHSQYNVLGPYLFYKTNLENLVLPTNISGGYRIDYGCFAHSKLKEITFPSNVNGMDEYILRNCTNLQTVTFPETITFYEAFGIGTSGYGICKNCTALTTVNMANNIKRIPGEAFRYCSSLKYFHINNKKTNAEYDLDLTSLTNDFYYIGGCGFEGTLFKHIDLPSSVRMMGDKVFKSCNNLLSVTVRSTNIDCNRGVDESVWDQTDGLKASDDDAGNSCFANIYPSVETGIPNVDAIRANKVAYDSFLNHIELIFKDNARPENYRNKTGWKQLLHKWMDEGVDGYMRYFDLNACHQEGAEVTFTRRNTDQGWATVVLPFDLSYERMVAAFGSEAHAAKLIGAKMNGDIIHFRFREIAAGDVLEANKPFILHTAGGEHFQIAPFDSDATGVEILDMRSSQFVNGDVQLGYTFRGIYQRVDADDSRGGFIPEGAYFVQAGKFYRAEAGNTLQAKPYRGFFQALGSPAKAMTLMMELESEDGTTAIDTIDGTALNTTGCFNVYNMAGQAVRLGATTLSGLPKGLYIVNGKKIIFNGK